MQKRPKMSVLAMLLSLAYSIGLILYILIDKNNIQMQMIIKMLGRVINSCIISIIYTKKSQKSGFGHFVKFDWFDGSIVGYIRYCRFWSWFFLTDRNLGADKGLDLMHDQHDHVEEERKIRFLKISLRLNGSERW